jgi:hypothetical protein
MSGVTAYLVRIELRRRPGSLLVVALLSAFVVAVVLAALGGARRTESAFDRYLAELRAPEAAAFGDPEAIARLEELDAVAETIDFHLVAAVPAHVTGEEFYPLVASEDGQLLYEHYRLPVVDGRLPDRDAAHEVAVGERTAERLGLRVGDELALLTFTPEGATPEGGLEEPDGPPITLDVVGVVRDPGDLGSREADITLTFLTPAFRAEHPAQEVGTIGEGAMVVLAPGHDIREVSDSVGPALEIDPTFSGEAFREQIDPTMRSLATGLRVFAGVAALAGLVAISLAAGRVQQYAAVDDRSLGALGLSRTARWARLAVPVGVATTLGVVVGGLLSIAASPLFPIGLARRAEPDLGLHIDAWVTIGGTVTAVAILLITAALTAASQRRRSQRTAGSVRTSPWGKAAAAAGAPVEAVTGFTLAGGASSGPAGIGAGGALLGVLGVLAVLVFAASMERLRDDPSLYGSPWDAIIEGSDLSDLGGDPDVADAVLADERVRAAGQLYFQVAVSLDGVPEYATAAVPVKGAPSGPVVVIGRAPSAGEIAVGQTTLDRLDAEVGDDVTLAMTTGDAPFRISGVVALPVSGDGGSLASGVLLSTDAVEQLDLATACADEETSCTRKIAVDLAEGVDPDAFAADVQTADDSVEVSLPTPPPDIDRLTAVDDLPRYLAAFLGALAATAIGFATATTVRQRRRDLAVLRVLGMTGRRVSTVVSVLVLGITLAGSAAGVVLGIVVGRQVWRWIAGAVSVPFVPELPVAALVLVPLGAVALAEIVATGGRRAAARVPTAAVLRAE